jgi:hypothetical protein
MARLQLEEPQGKYVEFYGRNVDKMPLLIANNRLPLSVAGLMRRRLEVLSGSEAVRNSWWNNYFDAGDGAIRHSDGRLMFLPDAGYLRQLNPETRLVNGSVPFDDDVYRKLNGVEFSQRDIERHFNKELSRREARNNPGWRALLRGDSALQREIVDATFAQVKERFNYDGPMIGIYPSVRPESGAVGSLWSVSRIGDYVDLSGAVGGRHLDYGSGRLVGVRQLGAEGAAQNLERLVHV